MSSTLQTGKIDPLLEALERAPVDDYIESDAERAACEAARADIRAGRVTPHADVLAGIERHCTDG